MPRKKTSPESLAIDIRDERLRGGRLTISSRTRVRSIYGRRKAAIYKLLEAGEVETIERLRSGALRIEAVQDAVEEGDLARLRRQNTESLRLGDVLARQLLRVQGLLQPGSAKAYQTLRNQLLARWGADRDISTVTTADVEAFLHEPKARGAGRYPAKPDAPKIPWSAARQEVMRVVGGAVWDREITREMDGAAIVRATPRLSRNPWKFAETPEGRPGRVAYLQPGEWQEVQAYLTANHPERLFVHSCGVLAGLRLGEVLHLRPEIDVDVAARTIHVQPREGEFKWRPKNRRGTRDVPMSDELLEIYARHMALFGGRRFVVRLPGKDQPITQPVIQDWCRDAFEAVGLKYGREGDGLTFHSTRHTFASWLAQRRFTTKEIAELIGDTEKTVSETYSHLSPSNLRDAVNAVGTLARGNGTRI